LPRDVEIGEGRSPRAARETRSGKDDRAGRDGGGGRGGVRNGRLGSAPGRIGSSGHVISATIGLLGDVPREGQSAGWAATNRIDSDHTSVMFDAVQKRRIMF
jgi:hypothetical protein